VAITAEAIVELFERDVRARKRLAELLVSEPDVRLAIINAVLRDVATKNDIERIRGEYATKEDVKILRDEMTKMRSEISMIRDEFSRMREEIVKMRGEYATKEDVEKMRREVSELRERMSKLEGVVSQLVERISDLDKRLDYVAKISWTLTAGVIATLIANIVILIITHGIGK